MKPGPRRGGPMRTGGRFGMVRRARVALRIAARSSLRARGRSALIVALIALPVAGMAAVSLIIPSTAPTTAERLRVELGHSQAWVRVVAAPDSGLSQDPVSPTEWGFSGEADHSGQKRSVSSLFPAGTEMIPVRETSTIVTTSTGVTALTAFEGETWNRALAGRFRVVSGRTPRSSDEIMVTSGALDRLGVRVGGAVTISAPATKSVTVVGVLDDRSKPSSADELFGTLGAFTGTTDATADPRTRFYLPNTVIDWHRLKKLNGEGAVAYSRAVVEHPPPPRVFSMSSSFGSSQGSAFMLAGIVFGFALLEVTLLAGAAFAVGVRAQERSLATVASVGAGRSTVLSVITAGGLVLGAIGGVLGVGLGIGAGALFMRLTDDGSATQYWGFHLWWPLMVGVAAVAVLVGWLGALFPGIRASRRDTVSALRGARRPSPPSRRRPVAGVVITLAGIAIALGGGVLTIVLTRHGFYDGRSPLFWLSVVMLVAGPVIVQLGLILCSRLLLRLLGRALSRVSVAARLSSRDAVRNPGRSVPVLAVIMSTVFGAVFAMTMVTSFETTSRASYQYRTVLDQVTVPVMYYDNTTQRMTAFSDPRQLAAAVRTGLEGATARVLSSVPDPTVGEAARGEPTPDPSALTPMLTVPPNHQCPADARSANYDPSMAPTSGPYSRIDDWRCRDLFVTSMSFGDGRRGHIWVGDEKDLALILGKKPSTEARAALADGGAVSFYRQYVAHDRISISWWPAKHWLNPPAPGTRVPPSRTVRLKAVVDEPVNPADFGILISPATATRLGLTAKPALVLASPKTPPSDADVDALNADIDALTGNPAGVPVQVERGPSHLARALSWGILGLSGVIAVGAAAIAIALARADGRRDDAVIAAVGGSRRTRRGVGFWQAIVLTGTGAILGAAVGFVPAVALTLPGSGTMLTVPWLPIVATALALPAAIAVGAWLFTPRGRPLTRRAAIE